MFEVFVNHIELGLAHVADFHAWKGYVIPVFLSNMFCLSILPCVEDYVSPVVTELYCKTVYIVLVNMLSCINMF